MLRLILTFVVALGMQLGAFASDWANAPVKTLGLYKAYADSAIIFDRNVDVSSIPNVVGQFLKSTVDRCAERAAKAGNSAQSIGSMRGLWLEWARLVALKQQGLMPSNWQAEFTLIPNA